MVLHGGRDNAIGQSTQGTKTQVSAGSLLCPAEQRLAADCLQRPVRRSSACNIPIVDGKDAEESLGSTAYLNPKGRGNKSLPTKPRTKEDADIVARRDPRDMAKATLPEVQGPSVHGGPLAPASTEPGGRVAQASGRPERPLRVQHRPMRAGKAGVDRLPHAADVLYACTAGWPTGRES